jgi:hypothetical protein
VADERAPAMAAAAQGGLPVSASHEARAIETAGRA